MATQGADFTLLGNGNDVHDALGGNDTVFGGNGNVRIFGGDDWTIQPVGGGLPILLAPGGDDRLVGGAGNDTLFGEVGNDTLEGGNDHDLLSGGAGDDLLLGGNGRDRMYGGAGDDTLNGGGGNDFIVGTSFASGGVGEIDFLRSGSKFDRDTFVLGEAGFAGPKVYYNGPGLDFAVIEDFDTVGVLRDKVQLAGEASDYNLGMVNNLNANGTLVSGVAIRQGGEIIGVLQDINLASVNLNNSNQFSFVTEVPPVP